MPKTGPIGPPVNKKDLSALLDILAPIFNFTREQGEKYAQAVGTENFRVIRRGSSIAGGCALLPLGQFFGGQSVRMTGVAAVGIAAEHRGQRFATTLMQSALREMHSRGCPISTLYPATLPLYRSVGYEQAGTRYDIRIPAKMLNFRSLERGGLLEMRRITPRDRKMIEQCYCTKAVHNSGNLDRSEFIWRRVRQPRGQATMGFVVINPKTKAAEGYTFLLHKECPEAAYSLHVTDLVALTPGAGRRLLSFFADHRSMAHEIIFQGTPDDPIIKLLPERTYSARLLDHWMLRIVDVGAALTARGYPPGVNAEIHLDVQDNLLTDNIGRYVLEVNRGKAKVSSGGRGDIKIDIRGLAALYTGHMSPHDLRITGQVGVSSRLKHSDDLLAAAASVFAGPTPWLGDMF